MPDHLRAVSVTEKTICLTGGELVSDSNFSGLSISEVADVEVVVRAELKSTMVGISSTEITLNRTRLIETGNSPLLVTRKSTDVETGTVVIDDSVGNSAAVSLGAGNRDVGISTPKLRHGDAAAFGVR